jgi:hypothetical protein
MPGLMTTRAKSIKDEEPIVGCPFCVADPFAMIMIL